MIRLCGRSTVMMPLILSSLFFFLLLLFCFVLLFASILCEQLFGKRPADCQLTFEKIWQLHTEPYQLFARRWHHCSSSLCLPVSLLRSMSKTDHSHTHRACFPRVVCAVSRTRRIDWKLKGNRSMNEPSACKDFMDISKLKLEHLCNV